MARSWSHGGDGRGAGSGRGVGQTRRVPGEPESSDRFQQLQDHITKLTAIVQQLTQQWTAAPIAPAPPVPPSTHVLGGDVHPPTVLSPPVMVMATTTAKSTGTTLVATVVPDLLITVVEMINRLC